MHFELTPEQDALIELGIREGRFRNRKEAVQQVLALSEKRERVRVELRASLDLAEKSLDVGEGEEYMPETLNRLVSSVEKRGRARLSSQ
jgi:Arc/MetJ-type ribon-helix-helix transcriptional regulator